jgi:protein-S-isoprenylcysteine O-methyltransferase Ste14
VPRGLGLDLDETKRNAVQLNALNRILVPAAWLFYLVLVFEILYMISPFAIYYYSSYGPVLILLHESAWTAWLSSFFLPHVSKTTCSPLNQLLEVAEFLIGIGLALFLVGFVQIYWAKLRRSGAVTGGLYAYIRHPQYVALAIMGLGTLLVWPRFLILIAYVSMLFLYAILARSEERNCLQKHGERYRDYLVHTGRFLPKAWTRGIPVVLTARGWSGSLVSFCVYVTTIVATVLVAFGLRDYSLAHLCASFTDNIAILSPALLTKQELDSVFGLASSNTNVRQRLDGLGPNAKLIVYVLPSDWYLADLPAENLSVADWRRLGGHHTPADFDRQSYKVLFTRALSYALDARGRDIVKHAYARDALFVVRVNTDTRQVSGLEAPAAQLIWGNIPTPMF